MPQSSSFLREWSAVWLANAATFAAAPLGIGGRTGVDTDSDAVNFSKDERFRNEFPEGLLGDPGVSSLPPLATTATIGRRGRLYRIVRLRAGCPESESVASALRGVVLVGDCSSALCLVLLAEGDGDREEEPHGFRARLTIRPDIERLLDGRAAGSGARVSGTLAAPSCASASLRSSDEDRVKCETETGGLFFERRDVRRKMSFPAATLSLVGDSARAGTA